MSPGSAVSFAVRLAGGAMAGRPGRGSGTHGGGREPGRRRRLRATGRGGGRDRRLDIDRHIAEAGDGDGLASPASRNASQYASWICFDRAAAEKPASTPSSARVTLLKLAVVSKATTPGTLGAELGFRGRGQLARAARCGPRR